MAQKRKVIIVLAFAVFFGNTAYAVTPAHLHVSDSFVADKPFEARVNLDFVFQTTSTRIAREFVCLADQTPAVCPEGNQLVMSREFDAVQTTQALLLDMRFGLYQDLELVIQLPYVIQDSKSVQFSDGVGISNSTLAGNLLSIPATPAARSGIGDLTFGLRFAPFHHDRHEEEPAWVFGVWYTAPTAPAMRYWDTNVGEGLHQLGLSLDVGYPVASWMEPWFGVQGTLRVPSDLEIYTTGFATQSVQYPGAKLSMKGGASMVPWTSGNGRRFLEITLGGYVHYTFEGREPTVLFEALGASPCSLDASCSLNNTLATGEPSNGITDLEGRAEFGGRAGIRFRVVHFLEINLLADVGYSPAYFLTYAIAGKDLNGNGTIEPSNAQGQNEYNPVYVTGIDELGSRVQAAQSIHVRVQAGLSGQF